MRTRSQTTSVPNVQLSFQKSATEMVAAEGLLSLRRNKPTQTVVIPPSNHRMTTRSMSENMIPANLTVYMENEVVMESSNSNAKMSTRSKTQKCG